jgi:hypothetical protein
MNSTKKLNRSHSSVATADLKHLYIDSKSQEIEFEKLGPTATSLPRRRFRIHNPSAGGDQR